MIFSRGVEQYLVGELYESGSRTISSRRPVRHLVGELYDIQWELYDIYVGKRHTGRPTLSIGFGFVLPDARVQRPMERPTFAEASAPSPPASVLTLRKPY